MNDHIDSEVFSNGDLTLKEYLESLIKSYQEERVYLSTVYVLFWVDNCLGGWSYCN